MGGLGMYTWLFLDLLLGLLLAVMMLPPSRHVRLDAEAPPERLDAALAW
jgi:hypothetical protein